MIKLVRKTLELQWVRGFEGQIRGGVGADKGATSDFSARLPRFPVASTAL